MSHKESKAKSKLTQKQKLICFVWLLWIVVAIVIGLVFNDKYGPTISFLVGISSLILPVFVYWEEARKFNDVAVVLGTVSDRLKKALFNEVTFEIFSALSKNAKLNDRMWHKSKLLKKEMAKILRQIQVHGVNGPHSLMAELFVKKRTFVESGSTYAYIALELQNLFNDLKLNDTLKLRSSHIITNNVLVYITLLLNKMCLSQVFPGTPSDQYGATYGADVDPNDPNTFGNIRKEIDSVFLNAVETGDVESTQIDYVFLAMSRFSTVWGPHVGSKENAKFKKEILDWATSSETPIIMMIDENKIEVNSEKPRHGCYSVVENNFENEDWSPNWFDTFCKHMSAGRLFLMICGKGNNDRDKIDDLRNALVNKEIHILQRDYGSYSFYYTMPANMSEINAPRCQKLAELLTSITKNDSVYQ